MGREPVDDPFATEEIRQSVLATWSRTPSRFREDANAEESLVLVGYADRVIVELAANASDAAILAGVPGRLRISVVNGEIRAANTGAPLTPDGVAALASLRASAKRDLAAGTGHFGVGFTAVLSVTDRPQIHSGTGAIEFSLEKTVAEIETQDQQSLTAELSLRQHLPPVLRLPWAIERQPIPSGFTTEIRLPLREGVDAATVLAAAGDYLLLTLPGLDVIELPDRIISRRVDGPDRITIIDNDVATSWQLAKRSGQLTEELSGQRPIEERGRRDWWITWAAPLGRALEEGAAPEVLYAPTPTDESLQLPARLIGTFPVDDTRRHVAVGPLAEFMFAEAVSGYLDLLIESDPDQRLRLIPSGGFGSSRLDTELRTAIIERARTTKLLLTVLGDAVAGEDAVVLPAAPDELAAMVAEAIPHLLPAPTSAAAAETLRSLGVRSLATSEMSTALGGLGRGPQFWGRLYELLGYASGDDLADLPVPLADGRTVLGGRGLLIPEVASSPSEDYAESMRELVQALPTLRLVDPEAVTSQTARQLLQRLGGSPADPSAILADPAVEAHLQSLLRDLEFDEPAERFEPFATAVLSLVARGGRAPDGLLADLVLTSEEGEPWPAGQLLLPGSELASLIDPDADIPFVSEHLVSRFGADTLSRAGVLADFRIVSDDEASGPDHDLPDEDLWWEKVVGESTVVPGFSAIADLDLIDVDQWPRALEAIRRNREALACLQPAPGGPTSYSRWWLSNFAELDGRPPSHWKVSAATDLGGLFEVLSDGLDADLAALVGVRTSLQQTLEDDPAEVLRRLVDPERQLASALVPQVTQGVVTALAGRGGLYPPPDNVRTMSGRVAPAQDALVLDEPWLAQVLSAAEVVPGGPDPQRTAHFFDLDLASVALESVGLRPMGSGTTASGTTASRTTASRTTASRTTASRRPDQRQEDASPTEARTSSVPMDGVVRAWLAIGGDPQFADFSQVQVIPDLRVEVETTIHRVLWWVTGDESWVDGSAAGWGRLLAHRQGRWESRALAVAVMVGTELETLEFGLG